MSADWLTRDGHLTALSLERHLAGEIDASDHLAACAVCRARLAALEADAAAVTLRPPSHVRGAAPAPATPWAIYGGVLAAAAAVLFFVLRPAPDPGVAPTSDGVRVKGGFDFEVHVQEGAKSRRLYDGDPVAPGATLGFMAKSARAGHLLILGRDGRGDVWLVYPQQGHGKSAAFAPADTMRDLKAAVRLDATPGDERFDAVLCAEPFDQRGVAPRLSKGEVPAGCTIRTLTLRKASP